MAVGGAGGGSGLKARYSYGELEGLWIAAGGPSRIAPIMAAIAMAESGGRRAALNPSDNGGRQSSFGLWQISTGTHAPPSPNWANPLENARLAVAKWKAGGFGPWGTYVSGAYRRFLRPGVPPVDPGGGVTGTIGIPYKNPFRAVKGFRPERIDMGVDFAGTGPVYALGEGVITRAATGTGWGPPAGAAPGGFIGERLTSGPLKGRYVFVAEGITPKVQTGQHVTAGTVIGIMNNSPTGIETGFAAPGGQGDALARVLGEYTSDGTQTAAGIAYAKILQATGTKTVAIPKDGGSGAGTAPSWIQRILHAVSPITNVGGAAGGLGGIGSAIQGISDWLGGLTTAVDWLLNPANWVRILAGVGGGVMVLSGVVVLSHVGGQVPIPGTSGSVSARPAALPVGILLVGGGGVLLFVAFHNLPGSPANISELLGSLRDESQAAAAGQKAAA